MNDAAELERACRRWLRLYPSWFRADYEAEMLDVLMTGARAGQRRPDLVDCLDLAASAVRLRLRPRRRRGDRAARNAMRLLYSGALLELVAGLVTLVTIDDVRASIVLRNPAYTQAQWQAALAGRLEPIVVGAPIAALVWFLVARAHGQGRRWARIPMVLLFGLNLLSLLSGLSHGSALNARADMTVGVVLCLVQLTALIGVFERNLRQLAVGWLGLS